MVSASELVIVIVLLLDSIMIVRHTDNAGQSIFGFMICIVHSLLCDINQIVRLVRNGKEAGILHCSLHHGKENREYEGRAC